MGAEVFEGEASNPRGWQVKEREGERTLLSTNKLATLLPFHRVDPPAGMGRGWLGRSAHSSKVFAC